MITREQLQELKELAKPIKYKVVKDGVKIRVDSKCSTCYASNDHDGYLEVKKMLENIIAKSKNTRKEK